MGWVAFIVAVLVTIWLWSQLQKKQEIDRKVYAEHQEILDNLSEAVQNKELELKIVEEKYNFYSDEAQSKQQEIDRLNKQSDAAIARYNSALKDKTEELEYYFDAQKRRRREVLDADLEQEENQRRELLNARMQTLTEQAQKRINEAEVAANAKIEELQAETAKAIQNNNEAIARYESIIEVARKLELEQQARLYYTIQVPEEYKDDIDYLMTVVSQKVQHPDIINKLVWTEYVKPYLDDTIKRAGIEDKPGIYKITNINDQKAYIGKSTNIKKRITDHMKSSCGINTIANQAVHHAIWKTGIWNWTIEPVIYCDKDQLNELEKYYIAAFKTQEHGFNKNSGGGG